MTLIEEIEQEVKSICDNNIDEMFVRFLEKIQESLEWEEYIFTSEVSRSLLSYIKAKLEYHHWKKREEHLTVGKDILDSYLGRYNYYRVQIKTKRREYYVARGKYLEYIGGGCNSCGSCRACRAVNH